MKVSDLKTIIALPNLNPEMEITGITEDSRQVKAGSLFINSSRNLEQATKFSQQALEKGAAIILTNKNGFIQGDNIFLVDNEYELKSQLACKFYPYQPRNNLAVTGTNGKTSTVHFTRQILSLAGKKAASIGTLGVIKDFNHLSEDIGLTTPGAIQLHQILTELYQENYTHLAIEASSHAIDQHRLDGLKIKAAAFTNFTQDHLDYHETMEAYFAAKIKLFDKLLPSGCIAVINSDIKKYETIKQHCLKKQHNLIEFGYKAKHLKLQQIIPHNNGMEIKAEIFGHKIATPLSLIGEFQAYNILASIGLLNEEIEPKILIDHLSKVTNVPGRMEKVPHQKSIYVDYAHTPDALEKTLKVARAHTKAKVILVFGCGGNRDAAKRPLMGEIAQKLADYTILTDDNPRMENPDFIRSQIKQTLASNYKEIANRKEAINFAIDYATTEDIVIIAGKGHEKYQLIGEEKFAFDDVEIAQNC